MEQGQVIKPGKRLLDAFLGKNGMPVYQRPTYEARPLTSMLDDLCKRTQLDWHKYVFSRDPLNGKFNNEQRKQWAEQAIACGELYAGIISEKYNTTDIKIIAQEMGMNVSYPAFPEKTDRVLFAEYREPNEINIFMDAVNKARQMLNDPAVKDMLSDRLDVADLLLAHEIFHCVEDEYQSEIYTRTEKVRLFSVGPIHNDSTIMAISEIAAMAFAKTLTGIPYSPYVMDVFLVYGYSKEEASGLYEEIIAFL